MGPFHCQDDAVEAKEAFEKEHKAKLFEYQLDISSLYRIVLRSFQENREEIEHRHRLLGTFILMTNRMDKSRLPDLEMLQFYKGQSVAETRFRLLKEEQMIDAVFKTPERIEALGIVYVMALLIYGMLYSRR